MNNLINQMAQDAESVSQDNLGKIGAVATDVAETDKEINEIKEQLKRSLAMDRKKLDLRRRWCARPAKGRWVKFSWAVVFAAVMLPAAASSASPKAYGDVRPIPMSCRGASSATTRPSVSSATIMAAIGHLITRSGRSVSVCLKWPMLRDAPSFCRIA